MVLKCVRKLSLPCIVQSETPERMLLALPVSDFTRKRQRLHVVLDRMLGFPQGAIGGSCIPEERRLGGPVFHAAGGRDRRLEPFDPLPRRLPDGQHVAAGDRVSGAHLIRRFILLRVRTDPAPSRFDVRPLSVEYIKSPGEAFAPLEEHLIRAGKDSCSMFRELPLNRPPLVVRALCGRPQTQQVLQPVLRGRIVPLQHVAGEQRAQEILRGGSVDLPDRARISAVKSAREHGEHAPESLQGGIETRVTGCDRAFHQRKPFMSLGETAHTVAHREVSPLRQHVRRLAKCDRKTAAQTGQVAGASLEPGSHAQRELFRFFRQEQVQVSFDHPREGEAAPGGDQEKTPFRRDQGLDLVPAGGIVQKQDCAALIEDGSVFSLQVRNNGGEMCGGLVRADDVRHHFDRGERLSRPPLHINVQLCVGIPRGELFSNLERESCLADASHPEQADYPGPVEPDLFHELGKVFRAAGKVGRRSRHLVKRMGQARFGSLSQSRALDLDRRGRVHWRTRLMDVQDRLCSENRILRSRELPPPETGGITGAGLSGNIAERMMGNGDRNHFRRYKRD